ncbi:MAG: glutamate mutase L, partial [Sporichthyaceae bacterium]
MFGQVLCIDFGSTFTKAALVDLDAGALVATASSPTTIDSDVMDGYDVCRAALSVPSSVPALACSSAGGGLRLAVVGYERAITAEAGYRVALSAGARVVHVASDRLDDAAVAALLTDRPDVVLLVGGTDGGNAETLLHNARRLSRSGLKVPVVVAGNVEVRDQVVDVLRGRSKRVVATHNVLPEIGRLDPGPARVAIRNVFIDHVIGGKGLSKRPEFAAMVRAATPDAVLAGVELLADGVDGVGGVGDVLVVDVGGATTDVYSVVTPIGEDATLRRDAVEVMWRSRTVEGDLGMRWNATGVVSAAVTERLVDESEVSALASAAEKRAHDPSYLPDDDSERAVDVRLAELAVTVALRRHGRGGKNLREVQLVVGSGGVLRHAGAEVRARILGAATGDL